MSDITGVILAGGVGTRFLPFVTDKTLFPFLNESLLHRTIKMLTKNGINKIIIATNGANHAWLQSVINSEFNNAQIILQRQTEPKGMGDALLSVRDLLPDNDILVMNAGDMVAENLLPGLLKKTKDSYAVVTGMVTHSYQPLGYFELEGNNVIGIQEKPGAENMPSNVANLVFHYFSDPGKFLELITEASEKSSTDDIYEQALTELMRQHEVQLYRYDGPWQKLKFGYHVLDMSEFFLRQLPDRVQIDPSAYVADSAILNGPVVIGPRARVYDLAVIQGPAYIGEDSIIGNHALIRNSLIERNSVVGYGSEIVRSYIGPECDLHHVYLGDSVLEKGIHFGFNAHVTNLRFDRAFVDLQLVEQRLPTDKTKLGALVAQGAEVGANSTIMPGVTLGANSLVYAGCQVYRPLPDDHTLKNQPDQTTQKREMA